MLDHYEGLLRERCAHTGTHALHFFYLIYLIIYLTTSGTIRTHKNYSLQIHNCN